MGCFLRGSLFRVILSSYEEVEGHENVGGTGLAGREWCEQVLLMPPFYFATDT